MHDTGGSTNSLVSQAQLNFAGELCSFSVALATPYCQILASVSESLGSNRECRYVSRLVDVWPNTARHAQSPATPVTLHLICFCPAVPMLLLSCNQTDPQSHHIAPCTSLCTLQLQPTVALCNVACRLPGPHLEKEKKRKDYGVN